MSQLTRFFEQQIVKSGDMSADVYSDSFLVGMADAMSVQLNWSGASPVGDLKVQVSNDGSTWVDSDAVVAVAVNTDSYLFNFEEPAWKYLRIFYDRTSGTGTLDVYLFGRKA